MESERRKQNRADLREDIIINGSLRARGLNLSTGGMYVHTGRSFKIGTIVTVTLPLYNVIINIQARVQHVQESVGMGLRFVDPTQEQLAAIRTYLTAAANYFPTGKKKVMIVDGNPATVRMLKGRLLMDGYTVLEANDGVDALALLEKEGAQLMILDLQMERLDGLKVLSILRQKPEWKGIPVIIYSARSSAADVENAKNAGATEVLFKMTTSPVKVSERVKTLLASRN
jgi:CheY-like chemotaxis protein